MSNAKSRILSGVVAHIYAQAVTVLTQLASLPIFLSRWDLELYGQWLMIVAMPAYLAISDVGLLTSAANLMAMHQARHETREVNRIFNSSLAAILVLVPLLAVFGGASLLLFTFGLSANQRGALYIMILAALFSVASGLFEAAYRPFGKYPKVTVLLTTARIIEWAGSVAGVFIGGTLMSAALGLLTGRAISMLAMIVMARRDIPEIRINLRTADAALIRRLLSTGVGFLSFPFGNIVTLQGMVLLVGAQLGGSAVALFSSIRTLTRMLTQISTLTGRAMAPEISLLYGAGDERAAADLSFRVLWKVVPITIVAALVLAPLGSTILRIWSHGKLIIDWTAYALLLAAAVASSFWQIKSIRLTATNRHAFLALIFAAISVIALLVAYVGDRRFGISAAAGATCLVEFSMIIGTNAALRRL
jgi:O-antigen/teichoic acid export membrane protein